MITTSEQFESLMRTDGRVVECTGLENRRGFIAHPGFESLSVRHFLPPPFLLPCLFDCSLEHTKKPARFMAQA